MKKLILKSSLLLVLLAVTGCQKFPAVTALMEGSSLVFEFNSYHVVSLHDLEMDLTDCKSDCVMWSAVNQVNENGELTQASLESGKLRYGQQFNDMETKVPPKQLVPGSYIIGGTTSTKERTKSLFEYEFTLKSDVSGTLVVVNKTK